MIGKAIKIIKKHKEYNDCLDEQIKFENFNTIEDAINKLNPTHYIIAEIRENGLEYNYKSTKTSDVLIIGETYEQCIEAYFIQSNKWSYCNNINIIFVNEKDKLKYGEYFFGKNGIGNYAACGGNMD